MAKKKKKAAIIEEAPKLFAWVVAYINTDYLHRVEQDLNKYPEYKYVEAYIPTIRVLRKTFKQKQTFEEVPLLFNYGFFKIPRMYAVHANFLDQMKDNIPCIYAWVKDPLKAISKSQNQDIHYATATDNEIANLVKNTFDYSAHDAADVDRLRPGQMIVLRGYPWEGITAEVVEILLKRKEVKVKITLFNDAKKEVAVSFDNVFFTMYRKENYDDNVGTIQSLDAMASANPARVDKVMFKQSKRNDTED